MSAASFFRRSCFPLGRLTPFKHESSTLNNCHVNRRIFRCFFGNRTSHLASKLSRFRLPPPPRGTKLVLCALSPAAFIRISENEEQAGKTAEEQMLEASRKELENHVPQYLNGSKFRRRVYFFIDYYIIEPFMTGVRFLHLALIFVPVLLTAPAIWFGKKLPDRDGERRGSLWWYGYLVWSMERAGASFIKLGQWAATRSDIFPKELCFIMSNLHSNVPPHSIKVTKRTVEKAFGGRPFEEIFDEFLEEPLGVGAIAQVYKAKLKSDLALPGDVDIEKPQKLSQTLKRNVDTVLKSTPSRIPSTYVAVKVLHPRVERIVSRDLRIMAFFAAVINTFPTMEWLSFPDEVKQFGEMMRLQLDLRIEAANLSMFRKTFKDRRTAWFPFPYTEYTTRKVLVEEYAQGIPLEHFLENGGGPFQKDIANEGLDAFLNMLLIDNFIHADLHPGNIMVRFYKPNMLEMPRLKKLTSEKREADGMSDSIDVTEEVLQRLRPCKHEPQEWQEQLTQIDAEGYRPQLIFIDTGLVTELNNLNRTNFLDLFKSIAEFDGYKAGKLMVERCRQPEAVIDPEIFALRMQHLVIGVKSKTFALGNMKIGDILNEVLSMVRNHHVRLEGDFVNVVLSILLLEGIGRKLDPDLDLFAGALPILRKLGAQGGSTLLRSGDFAMLKVWVGLEARTFLQASIESVERAVKYDQLSPSI